jgi:hypothetical protein
LLEEKKWNCPEAAELTKWTRILARLAEQGANKLPSHAINNDSSVPLAKVLFSTASLRHSAVHRLPTSARGIDQMIQAASKFAKTLRDPLRTAQLEDLHREMESRIRDMELNKNFLENRLEDELQKINEQRAELDEREKNAVTAMLRDDLENKSLIGNLLEASVERIFKEDYAHVRTFDEEEPDTDADSDKESFEDVAEYLEPVDPLIERVSSIK